MNMKNDRVIAVIYFIAGAMCVLAALNYFRHTNRRIALGALMLCAAAAVIIAGVVWIKKNAAAKAASKIRTGGWNGGIEADGNEKYLLSTPLLDFNSEEIKALVLMKGWKDAEESARIRRIYTFVRDNVEFGFNLNDYMPASKILHDGYGQLNNKAVVFAALLRACSVPCRIHAYMAEKILLDGILGGFFFDKAPQKLLCMRVEVHSGGRWIETDAFALDKKYLDCLRDINPDVSDEFYGYGFAEKNFQNIGTDWTGENASVLSRAFTEDLGVFASPDELLDERTQPLRGAKAVLYSFAVRHFMNKNIKKIRESAPEEQE
ncbi:MAG: transglutaminase domain-containing protein [Clostridia bacterium]|nr:transglutaminase domain-containing protein [Clostridia bacterium]